MSLYVVRHQHSAETCPARVPEMGQMLVHHVDKNNARKFGVDILGDAVIDGQHTFVLIVESEDRQYIENFMQPFARTNTGKCNFDVTAWLQPGQPDNTLRKIDDLDGLAHIENVNRRVAVAVFEGVTR